jgi:hypothetical protein
MQSTTVPQKIQQQPTPYPGKNHKASQKNKPQDTNKKFECDTRASNNNHTLEKSFFSPKNDF